MLMLIQMQCNYGAKHLRCYSGGGLRQIKTMQHHACPSARLGAPPFGLTPCPRRHQEEVTNCCSRQEPPHQAEGGYNM
jgi:hypothetical protein